MSEPENSDEFDEEESDDLDEIENEDADLDIDDDDDSDLDDVDDDDEDADDLRAVEKELSQKDQNARSLAIRREIERRMEQKRLAEDLDYLDLDDD